VEKSKVRGTMKLVVSLGVCQIAGALGSLFTAPSIATWYVSLKKPVFTPPNWVFAPVWLTLFVLMGVAVFLVWRKGLRDSQPRRALTIFGVQLALNISWSGVFFSLQSPLAGLVVIIVLWVAILVTILSFLKVSRPAGLLLVPYIVWVSAATALNASIVIMNR